MPVTEAIRRPRSAGDVFALIRDGVATRTEVRRAHRTVPDGGSRAVAALARRGLVTEREEATVDRRPAADAAAFNADAGWCWPWRSAAAAPSWRSATWPARSRPRTDIDSEIGVGPDDLVPDLVKRLEVLLDGTGRPARRARRRGEPARAPSTSSAAAAWTHR